MLEHPRRRSLIACLVVLLAGCGGDGLEIVPVKGKVTVGGSPPPAAGILYFTPVETMSGMPSRPATAEFDTTGNYVAKAFEDREGLIPGRYRVAVHCWKSAPTIEGPAPLSHIQDKYCAATTSGLELTVEEGLESKEWDLELKPW